MDKSELLQAYENYMVNTKRSSKGTVRAYMSDLKQFTSVVVNPVEAKRPDILGYVNGIGSKFEASSIQRKVSAIQSLYTFMEEYQIVSESVANKIPTPTIRKKKFNCPETETIEDIIAKEPLDSIRCAIALGAFVGLRVSETCNLKMEDVDFEKGVATLYNTKTALEDTVLIDSVTLASLKTYVTDHHILSGSILRTANGKPWKERNLHTYLQNRIPFNYHALRHHCASRLANEAGIEVAKQQLRHAQLSTTISYIHVNHKNQLNALDNIRKG